MKVGDEVWYTLLKDTPRKWSITSIWNTNTEEGLIAHLERPDDSKKLGVDRCQALTTRLEPVKE